MKHMCCAQEISAVHRDFEKCVPVNQEVPTVSNGVEEVTQETNGKVTSKMSHGRVVE